MTRVFVLIRLLWRFVLAGLGCAASAQTYSISRFPVSGSFSTRGIAVDTEGNIFFADPNRSTVGRISPAGALTVVAGAFGQTGATDGLGAEARFNYPVAVALDGAGNLYVCDPRNFVVRKIAPTGMVTTFAGRAGIAGTTDGLGQDARFSGPGLIAVDGTGNVWVEDGSLMRKISPAGLVTTLALSSPTTASAGNRPFNVWGIAIDRAGNLFFSDRLGATIRRVTPSGEITIFAGNYGQRGMIDGVGADALFSEPLGLAFDAVGNLLVVDSPTLRRIAPDGTVTTIMGQPGTEYQGAVDGIGGSARLASPVALSFDRNGNLFLLESSPAFSGNGVGDSLRRAVPTTALSQPILTLSPTDGGRDRAVGARATVTFAAAASGTSVAFQWFKDGVPISGANSATFSIASAVGADEGVYWVRVSNAAGSFTSDGVRLRVFEPAFDAFTSQHVSAGGSFLWGIASGAGLLVTVGTEGKILTSMDGRTWTTRVSGTTEWLVGVTYGAGKFVATGDHGIILVSNDGIIWLRATASGTTQRLNNVAFGENRFVAVGEGGVIVTSTDARTWVPQNSGVTTWLRGLVYDGAFYASGQNGAFLTQFASNGNWGRVSSSFNSGAFAPKTGDIEALASGPIGIGQDGLAISRGLFPLNTITYPKFPGGVVGPIQYVSVVYNYTVGLRARFRGLARGAGAIFATGENGVIAAAQSFNGPWSFIPTGTTANLVSGAFHGNSMFVVGENETILQSQPLYQSKLINLATRGLVGSGDPMIAGFVINGTTPKQVLVRAAGPGLGRFGIAAPLNAPVLTLFDGAGRSVASNSGWGTSPSPAAIATAAERAGAFPFAANSLDAAVFTTLPPGAYTAQVTGGTGTALVEVYDLDALGSLGSHAVNIATRAQLGSGEGRLIAGFVINGAASRQVLIRAVGPSLAQFGLSDFIQEPQIELYDQRGRLLQRVGAWSVQTNATEIYAASQIAGAFVLNEASKDSALVTTLLPGSYTVQVSSVNGSATGNALVEVYDLP